MSALAAARVVRQRDAVLEGQRHAGAPPIIEPRAERLDDVVARREGSDEGHLPRDVAPSHDLIVLREALEPSHI